MALFELKKWYFDVITEKGDILYVYFIVYRLAGVGRAVLSAHLVTADGRHVRDSLKMPAPSLKNEDRLDFGKHGFEKVAGGYHVFLDLARLPVDLHYAPQGEWRPNRKGILLKKGRRTLGWEVPHFRASVSGTFGQGSEKTDAAGAGYGDVVWTDIPPWRLPVSELSWGRAHFPSATLVFNQLTTRESGLFQNILVKRDGITVGMAERNWNGVVRPRLRWIDDFQFELRDHAGHGTATLSHPVFSLSLEEKKVLEESPFSTPDRIGWASLDNALSRLSGRPAGRKVLSEARLDMGGCSERGLAIHERILWNRRFGRPPAPGK